jgi:hypothetical protein
VRLAIPCIALFVSLGGVSYGVATGFVDSREIRNNTIRGGDVHNNSLRTYDIRNNEVRGFDVRDSSIQANDIAADAVSGADVAESSLLEVPNAAQADTAPTVSVLKTIPPKSFLTLNSPVTLLTHGPLTVIAACDRESPGNGTAARVQVQSTEPGAAAGTVEVPDLTPGAPVTVVELIAPFGSSVADDSPIFAMAGGKALTGELHLSAIAIGAGGYACGFSGRVVVEG